MPPPNQSQPPSFMNSGNGNGNGATFGGAAMTQPQQPSFFSGSGGGGFGGFGGHSGGDGSFKF